MRFLTSLLCVLFLSGLVVAQKRYLVSPNQEVMPLPPGQSPEKLIDKYMKEKAASGLSAACGGEVTFGYDPGHNPPNVTFGFTHKTTMGEWFVAPASGNIDTFYFTCSGVGPSCVDSQAFVRIFESFITPAPAPGIFRAPYPSPARTAGSWGGPN